MTNYLAQWRRGQLEDDPTFEKLTHHTKQNSNEKEQTKKRDMERTRKYETNSREVA